MTMSLRASVAALLLFGAAATAADLKSGPQKGQGVGAFNPKHATGAGAGGSACLV